MSTDTNDCYFWIWHSWEKNITFANMQVERILLWEELCFTFPQHNWNVVVLISTCTGLSDPCRLAFWLPQSALQSFCSYWIVITVMDQGNRVVSWTAASCCCKVTHRGSSLRIHFDIYLADKYTLHRATHSAGTAIVGSGENSYLLSVEYSSSGLIGEYQQFVQK